MKQKKYGVNAPYIKWRLNTTQIMLCVIAALIPAGIHGIVRFGSKAAQIILVTSTASVLTEFLFEKLTKKPVTTKDCRALLTGLLMSYCLPPSVEWQTAATAGILCVLIMQCSQHFFGRNVVSPVILTRVLLMAAVSGQISGQAVDGLSMVTPLAVFEEQETVDVLSMILGKTAGCIGETSVLLLCVGAMFLLFMGIIDFRVSGMYLFSFTAFMAVFGGHGLSSYYLTVQLAGGGLMLALWYIAPAYSTLPITKSGRWIYGILLGVLTGISRLYGNSPGNLCYAILCANLLIPVIEKVTIRRPFGIEKGQL